MVNKVPVKRGQPYQNARFHSSSSAGERFRGDRLWAPTSCDNRRPIPTRVQQALPEDAAPRYWAISFRSERQQTTMQQRKKIYSIGLNIV